ncbi:unnamed protein product [Microthlaspi erraticum]|uniref:C2H2-type domain-containing protein n=1 Tax=Microthlaspi erraticum TaxID=1685480 RepID=A0A6D2IKW9_9BRAS|nr:unnamed protein product [Microthlaspi erraticum]
MSSFPNGLNSYGGFHGSFPIQMNSIFMDRSTFIASDDMNHRGLLTSSPAFNRYQDSHVASPSFGFNNPHVAYQMRENMVDCFPILDNPHLSQVTFTETITKRYSAIVPTNHLATVQNGFEGSMNPNNIWNPSFAPPNFANTRCEILNPTPLNTFFPDQDSVYPRHVDFFSSPPKRHHDQNVPVRQPVKKRCKPTRNVEGNFDGFGLEEDGDYDGRTHSLPYEKYGPYTCPKCKSVFDSSQKFAAHVSSSHYKNETLEEKAQRYNARNKRRLRKMKEMMNGESQGTEDNVVEDTGGNNNIASDIEAFQHQLIVKEEPVYDFV